MSNASSYWRRRPIGRASSPPTWACYEQILHYDDSGSGSDDDHSCSEDDEDYAAPPPPSHADDGMAMDMDGVGPDTGAESQPQSDMVSANAKGKGKERAVDVDLETQEKIRQRERELRRQERERKRKERPVMLRPILTIQKSQGFVWNQDLFVPAYCKDRYIASTSPPTSHSPFASGNDFDPVEVVEIRIEEGESWVP
ncbi:hypothetical protein BDZ89DRAFT_1171610 [Hymenopellis radicata]|nr:hypothetical protein BDZ89DRAFT_1171610 [Hymenopellis radicata]